MNLGPLPNGRPIEEAIWAPINRAAVAKAIGELSYEEAFEPVSIDAGGSHWELRLSETVSYRFEAVRRIWGQLSVRPNSLRRMEADVTAPVRDAVQFMVDAQEKLAMTPETLCTYAKELYNTLMADARIAASGDDVASADLVAAPDSFVQQLLDGHPKAPANKGRLGWGLSDFAAHAPEFQAQTRLFWAAAARSACATTLAPQIDEEQLLAGAMDARERSRLAEACAAAGVGASTHQLIPIHPWQWDNMIAAQFAGEIAARRLTPLGVFGDAYWPQQSLRTLANASNPCAPHVKLPLTILNTSAWRGVPGKYMAMGPDLSQWLHDKTRSDATLSGVVVLREIAGLFYPHPLYERTPDAPYQFREMLGAIWRESPEMRIGASQRALMMGALTRRDAGGRPLVSALIDASGLGRVEWLDRLFGAVVVPLYHFMCRYGVAFIAHGQNVTVILDGPVPVGVAVKDFQGDVDLVDQDFPELADLPQSARATLGRRPPKHLIHHLQTGHFASVLRFLSDALADHDGLPETVFYATLASRLRRYQTACPELAERFALFDLFEPSMPRICINRVRFAIGYGDARQRPVPSLGSELRNPLYVAETAAHARAASSTGDGLR